MAKVLYNIDIPDMRKYRKNSDKLAQAVLELNKERIMSNWNKLNENPYRMGEMPTPQELVKMSIDDALRKNPGISMKEAVMKAMNSTTFTTREERYAKNAMAMLKSTGKYDELRRLVGWNKGIKPELFEYDERRGRLVYAGLYVIDHDEDYFAEDGMEIVPIEEFDAYNWDI
jgi:hypothetical protein